MRRAFKIGGSVGALSTLIVYVLVWASPPQSQTLQHAFVIWITPGFMPVAYLQGGYAQYPSFSVMAMNTLAYSAVSATLWMCVHAARIPYIPLERRRQIAGQCQLCGYDLTETESRICPECGNKCQSCGYDLTETESGICPKCESKCQSCGYDLTGNESGICPECGAPIEGT